MPGTTIKEHGGSDKAMVWSCVDFADESQKMELFCIRFASAGAQLLAAAAAVPHRVCCVCVCGVHRAGVSMTPTQLVRMPGVRSLV